MPGPKPAALLKVPRWSEFVTPTTLVSHSASQPTAPRPLTPGTHLPSPAAPLLSQCRTPVPQALVPNLLQPKSTSILFVNTSKDFQLSTPKPLISRTPEPLIASVPYLPLPSLPNTFPSGFAPTTMPLHFNFFMLYGSISTQPDSPLPTAGPQALLGSQLFYLADTAIDFVAAAVPHPSSDFLPAFTAIF